MKNSSKNMKVLFLCFILATTFTGVIWPSFSDNHHRVVIKFEEGKVSISQSESKLESALKKTKRIKDHAVEVIDELAVVKAGEKAIKVMEKAKKEVVKKVGMAMIPDGIKGEVKDVVVKLKEWDSVDSPKRIGEDIEQNASLKIEHGVEKVMETSPNELVTWSKNAIISDMGSVVSWCYLLGFSIAYGMGVWVTFLLGKCFPKQQFEMVFNKMNMVYFRAMGCCVGVALLGFLVSQGIRGSLYKKMEMFQGFNLGCAFVMILINLIFLEPRATKFIVQRMEGTSESKRVLATENLKKINTYSSTLNVSTMVLLTWHLAYSGRLLQS